MNAQDDVILKSDGDQMHGKILKINNDNLQFICKNKTIWYTVNKAGIIK